MPSAFTISALIVTLSAASITIRTPGVDAQTQVHWALPGAGVADASGMCHLLLMADRTRGFSHFREDVLSYMKYASAAHTLMRSDKAFVNPKNGFTACLEWLIDDSTDMKYEMHSYA